MSRRLLLGVAPALCFLEFIASVTPINGKSMSPTLNPDTMRHDQRDWVLLDKFSTLRIGDVVTFTAPHDVNQTLVKRIVATEGDIVYTRPHLFKYEYPGLEMERPPKVIKVPKGFCWVESDESYRGIDSNVFGPVPLGLMHGRAAYVVWPPERFGPVSAGKIRRGIEHVDR
ncbi:hypothetical protein HDU78_009678 [Chytriomyces hyalinus]|uniref:Mitochondrial inner membrane protease subunit n=1 Tax=Chytriomyces confervae TaxID=246404 RepID=A0A507EQS9_9FUNG|nr:hypothetical protein HDU78_009678 [Chytriomyces hyalinus]KAJ3399707.1 hypothetical protein HDU80_007664 [Chytriomyces hyalinus]TPX66433.1 hypothetical protein CcCBS67573_g07818 [Chytriomyces confervae]